MTGSDGEAAGPVVPDAAATLRGDYAVNEHLASPQDVAKRYGTSINWESIGTSAGLTSQQARSVHTAAACVFHAQLCMLSFLPCPRCGGLARSRMKCHTGCKLESVVLTPATDLCACIRSTITTAGLTCAACACTPAQVAEAHAAHGTNALTPPRSTPEFVKFLLQFTNPLMALLLVAGGLTFMAYALQSPRDVNNAILAAALIIVVTLTCIMSYLQERSASNLMGAFN